MVDGTSGGTDDLWTVIAVAAVVCMLGSVLHEVLGHVKSRITPMGR